VIKPSLEHEHSPNVVAKVSLPRKVIFPDLSDNLGVKIAVMSQSAFVEQLFCPLAQ